MENNPLDTSEYPSFEGKPFLPDRTSIDADEQRELLKLPNPSQRAYGLLLEAGLDLEANERDRDARQRVTEYGQIAGKLQLRQVEGVPVSAQKKMIDLIRTRCARIHMEKRVPMNGFMSGVAGEFATGVIMRHAKLPVEYPTKEDDMFHNTDLNATGPGGRRILVQAKAIALPLSRSREIKPGFIMPVFSPLETQEQVDNFLKWLDVIPARANSVLQERVLDLKKDAYKIHNQGLKTGALPIISLLTSAIEQNPDIDSSTFRPNFAAEVQAVRELKHILTKR